MRPASLPPEIYCCGLLSSRKSDCTGLPPSMLTNPATPPARGQHQIKMKGNMSLICWYNKGHFRFLTNAYSPVQQGERSHVGARGRAWPALQVMVVWDSEPGQLRDFQEAGSSKHSGPEALG